MFSVVVTDGQDTRELFSQQYQETGAWQAHAVDLSAYAGREVLIKLVTDPGPADNTASDWALWGAPRLVRRDNVVKISLHEDQVPAPFAPSPAPLRKGTKFRPTSATLHFEGAGINGPGANVGMSVYLNGALLGVLPVTGTDTEWQAGQLTVPGDALGAVLSRNHLEIQNAIMDYMKIRNVRLEATLADGQTASSWIHRGPWTSVAGWRYAEGVAVSAGSPLPTMHLDFEPTCEPEN